MSSELAELAERFRGFAEFSPSPLYARLAAEVAGEEAVAGLLLEAPRDQRWPMLLLAAVNLEARRWGVPFPGDGDQLAEFCVGHREALLRTIRSRRTQTNEVGRCAYLLPCFAHAADGRPLALIEVGASRGLVLNCDRYAYEYSGRRAGDPDSPLTLHSELRSGDPPLELPEVLWRRGVDLAPAPEDEWLRACVFADQPERLERLDAALAIAAEHPPPLIDGDALALLPELIAGAPPGCQVIVFHTAVLAYLQPEDGARLAELAGTSTHVRAEHAGVAHHFALEVNGEEVGRAHPHGAWLEWDG